MRGMYLHAERLLAKAGGSNCKGRGLSHPWNEAKREWKGRATRGLHKRSAEAWGYPLRARGAELPLAAFAFVCVCVFQEVRVGVAGRNRPAKVGGEGPPGRRQGGRFLPAIEHLRYEIATLEG